MKCLIYLWTIHFITQFSAEELVVLNPNDEDKSHEITQLDPAAQEAKTVLENSNSRDENPDEVSAADQDYDGQAGGKGKSNEKLNGKLESSGESNKKKKKKIVVLDDPEGEKGGFNIEKKKLRNWMRWKSEVANGNLAEIFGTNPHISQPDKYSDLNRRFVPQYPYTEVGQKDDVAPQDNEIVPIKAPLELVELVAKESALIEAAKPKHESEEIARKKILRTGDYWNGVWKEEVDPSKPALRTAKQQVLGTIKAKVKPGSEFYRVVKAMKKLSPRLLYIINKD